MKFRSLLLPLFLLFCGISTAQAQLTGVARTIPGSMFGTFDLEMEGATPFSLYPDGTAVSLTLAIDGSLCAPGLRLRNPFIKNGDRSRVYWSDADIGLEFWLDINGAFSGFGIGSPAADGSTTVYGTFKGEREAATDPCDTNTRFFNLAEANYPELFPGSIFVLTSLGATSFTRYYSVTGIVLGIANGVAYASGGPYHGTVLLGSVDELVATGVDDLIVGSAEPVVLPSILSGTYSVTFSSAGSFSPLPAGARYDLALKSDGSLCFDGVLLGTPYQDPSSPNLVNWGSANAGFTFQLDPGSSNGTSVQIRVISNDGLLLGTLSGNRSQLLAECAGLLGGNFQISTVNELFSLAEQLYPALFPASALTFNQFDGMNLLRFYPASGVLVTIEGSDVLLSGGPYGATARRVGSLATLLQTLKSKAPGFIPYKLRVTGNVIVEIGSLPPINRRIEMDEGPLPVPSSTDSATLTDHVQQVLGDELKGTSTFIITNAVATANSLRFDVEIDNRAIVVTNEVARTYTLRFVYTKQ